MLFSATLHAFESTENGFVLTPGARKLTLRKGVKHQNCI